MKKTIRFLSVSMIALLAIQGLSAEGQKEAPASAAQDYKVKIFANWNPEVNEADFEIFKIAEKDLGLKIEFEIPPSASYNERMQIMLASGDYPNLVLFNDTNDKIFIDAVNSGAVIPITKQVAAAPNLQKYSYKVSWDAMQVKGDGQIYGMPRTSIARQDGFFVRRDWLNKVGLGSIKDGQAVTPEEFAEILRRFTKNDPDGNGKADTYGFAAAAGADGNLGILYGPAFDLIGWREYTDEPFKYLDPQYSKTKDNFKRAIDYTAALWKEGLIDPDFPVVKRDASIQRFKQGVTGVIGEFAGWMPQYQSDMVKLNPKVELTYIVGIKNSKGVVSGGSFGTGTWGV
jgi:putative aldouronate transport system substrate-binding protein